VRLRQKNKIGVTNKDNVLFLEAMLEVISARTLSSTNTSCLAARLCLLKLANNGSDWLPPGEIVVRIGIRAMCQAVSGEKFAPTENAGYSTNQTFASSLRTVKTWSYVVNGLEVIRK
jgi:hypothetical protein